MLAPATICAKEGLTKTVMAFVDPIGTTYDAYPVGWNLSMQEYVQVLVSLWDPLPKVVILALGMR